MDTSNLCFLKQIVARIYSLMNPLPTLNASFNTLICPSLSTRLMKCTLPSIKGNLIKLISASPFNIQMDLICSISLFLFSKIVRSLYWSTKCVAFVQISPIFVKISFSLNFSPNHYHNKYFLQLCCGARRAVA